MDRDAGVLGIRPPHTVRIDLDGWVQDWPWETVRIDGDMVRIVGYTGRLLVAHALYDPLDVGRRGLCYYPYEHRHERTDGSWLFIGGITHRDFIVSEGPVQPPSMDTYGPARGAFAA